MHLPLLISAKVIPVSSSQWNVYLLNLSFLGVDVFELNREPKNSSGDVLSNLHNLGRFSNKLSILDDLIIDDHLLRRHDSTCLCFRNELFKFLLFLHTVPSRNALFFVGEKLMALNLQEINVVIHRQVKVLWIGVCSVHCDVIFVVIRIKYLSLIQVCVIFLEGKVSNRVIHCSIEVIKHFTSHFETHRVLLNVLKVLILDTIWASMERKKHGIFTEEPLYWV